MGFVLRVLAVLLLLRFLFRFLAGVIRGYRGEGRGGVTEMVRDPVCNTFLPRERAFHARVGGREEHFCSPACRDRALGAA